MFKQPPLLIGLTGGPGAGKDTVASLLVTNHGFSVVGFSDALRDFMYATDFGFKSAVDTYGYENAKRYVGGLRERMIEVGTAAREWINPLIWTEVVEHRIDDAMDNDQPLVVTGVRYLHEVHMIRANHGVVIGVDRPGVVFENDEYRDTFLAADDYLMNHGDLSELSDNVDLRVGSLMAA